METRYQGRWDVSMMADYCWCLKHDCRSSEVARKVKREKFMPHTNEENTQFSLKKILFYFLFAIYIFHSRESDLNRYILDGSSALA